MGSPNYLIDYLGEWVLMALVQPKKGTSPSIVGLGQHPENKGAMTLVLHFGCGELRKHHYAILDS